MQNELEAGPATLATSFADRLAETVDRKRSQLVAGLEPRPELLPLELRGATHAGRAGAAEACERFCRGIVDAVAPYVVAVKPQLAHFEALGSHGIAVLEELCGYARAAGLLVLLDGKRGDIGSTARAYAEAYLEERGRGAPARRCAHRQSVLGTRLPRAAHLRVPPLRLRPLLPRQDFELG